MRMLGKTRNEQQLSFKVAGHHRECFAWLSMVIPSETSSRPLCCQPLFSAHCHAVLPCHQAGGTHPCSKLRQAGWISYDSSGWLKPFVGHPKGNRSDSENLVCYLFPTPPSISCSSPDRLKVGHGEQKPIITPQLIDCQKKKYKHPQHCNLRSDFGGRSPKVVSIGIKNSKT